MFNFKESVRHVLKTESFFIIKENLLLNSKKKS